MRAAIGPAAIAFLSVLSFTFVFSLYPYLQEHYGFTTGMISVLATGSALPQAFLAPFLGLAQDRYGRRAVLVPCLSVWVLGAVVQVFALTSGVAVYPLFLTGRFLQALADAGFFQIALSLVADAFAGSPELGRAMALIESSASAGGIIGPVLTAAVLPLGPWAPSALTGLAGVALLFWLGPTVPAGRPGQVAAAASQSLPAQVRAALPTLRGRVVLGAYLAGGLCMFTLQGVQTFLGFVVRDRYGLVASGQGLILTIVSAAMLVGAQFTPALLRRLPNRTLLPLGLGASGFLFAVLALPLSQTGLTVGLAAGGLVLGMVLPLGNGVLAGAASEETRGVLMALNGATRQLGSLIAPLIIGFLLPTGYAVAYGTAALLAVVINLVSAYLVRGRMA